MAGPRSPVRRALPGRHPRERLGFTAADAISGHGMLAGLLQGHAQAQHWFDIVRPLLPATLANELRAGPLHEGCWTLLASSGAAAAKARHALPTVLAALQARGEPLTDVKVKVLQRQG